MKAASLIATAVLIVASFSARAAPPHEPKFVDVGGARLAYVEQGRGEPVILVHGGMQDYRMWAKVSDVLSQHYRVISYSRRNHFPNPVDKDDWPDTAADLHARDLASLVSALKLGPVNIVAHSSGAHTALFLVADHPELVRTLVVNEPPASGLLADTPSDAEIAREFGQSLAPSRKAFQRGDLQAGVALFTNAVSGPGAFDRRNPEAQTRLMDNAIAHQADALSTRPRPTYTCAMARRITIPVLITNGDQSPRFFHAITDVLAHCIPGAERASFVSSHGVPGEQPELFAHAVSGFLEKHPK